MELLFWVVLSLFALFWLYTAARLVARAVIRTLDERRKD